MRKQQSGFTLLELSIVIVIIGLIVAGISAGQSLVRQAGLRGVMTSVSTIETAANAFRLQYDALPGDIANATDYWGTGGTGACPNGLAETVDGCNGDGDKRIDVNVGTNSAEMIRSWQHLAFAGVIEGTYSGSLGISPNMMVIGTNVPEIGISNVTGYAQYLDSLTPGPGSPVNGNGISVTTFSTGLTPTGFLTAAEAASIDSKYDDGTVNFGKILVGDPVGGGCTTGASPNSTFQFTDTTTSCSMFYKLGF